MDNKYKFHKRIDGITFYAPSLTKNKKYDVYIDGKRYSFGDVNYEQFEDKIGYYKSLNHYDMKRRNNFLKRHGSNNGVSIMFSKKYLW